MGENVKKTVPIEYEEVESAYRKVRRGGKAAGIDEESWQQFDAKLQKNLYVIWNRMASGSYFPQAVKEVEIPKKDGKMRKLGIPTLRDRIAQQVVKEYMEKRVDQLFHDNSYGYRPLKSAHQAIEQVRQNCYKQDWVIDMDISKFFDDIDHELMLKAVRHVIPDKWVEMYVRRWLEMPIQTQDGQQLAKDGKGTPQGGVISPLLSNLFLHFALDIWLSRQYPTANFVRYADDVIIHCVSETMANKVLAGVKERLSEVKLRVNEGKTRIVYCRDYLRTETHKDVQFEFLGFSYQPRPRISKRDGKTYTAYAAEISRSNQKRIREVIKSYKGWKHPCVTTDDIARYLNPKLRGWINYYGIYSKKKLWRTLHTVDLKLINRFMKLHKTGFRKATKQLLLLKRTSPALFYHWKVGY
jgi:RNA-directed DNA polymerase